MTALRRSPEAFGAQAWEASVKLIRLTFVRSVNRIVRRDDDGFRATIRSFASISLELCF